MPLSALLLSAALLLSVPPSRPANDALPVFGPSVQVDPGFDYYKNRSVESVAAEVRANGYRIVRYVVTNDKEIDPKLIAAFHGDAIGVWYLTFGNGVYSVDDLPKEWPAWRMKLRAELEGKPPSDEFIYLCLNNPAYRAWKKQTIAHTLRAFPFQGIDIAEPHWPEYPGVTSPAYGCFCEHCLEAFRRRFPEEKALPDIVHSDSPLSPKNNPSLWRKWLVFRQASVTDFLNDLVNGKGGIREAAPTVKVCAWTLALREKDAVERMRIDSGEDAAEVARVVKPDLYCLQTHWPDWTDGKLPADYARAYEPFVRQVRSASPRMKLMIQADTGSQTQNRRSWDWIKTFERTCRSLDVQSSTFYEYYLGLYIYTDPPHLAEMRRVGSDLELRFTKCIDPTAGCRTEHYTLSEGQVVSAKVDGSVVLLDVKGLPAGAKSTLTVRDLPDDIGRRFFKDYPATVLREQKVPFRY